MRHVMFVVKMRKISNNNAHYIFDGYNTYHGTYPFRLELLYESGVYKLRRRDMMAIEFC